MADLQLEKNNHHYHCLHKNYPALPLEVLHQFGGSEGDPWFRWSRSTVELLELEVFGLKVES
jgi:hypothetical protein